LTMDSVSVELPLLVCRYCEKEIHGFAKCGALICADCCRACREEDGGKCQHADLKRAERENRRNC
jgi:hypothetical protein